MKEVIIPTSSIICMMITLITVFVIPALLVIYVARKEKKNLRSILIGALTFTIAVLLFESGVNAFIFQTPLGNVLKNNLIAYALFGGLMAGLFEESGRYFAYRHLMKKEQDYDSAFAYGVGHGGIEAILLVGFTYISNLMLIHTLQTGNINELVAATPELETVIQIFNTTPAFLYLIAGVERIFAIGLHLALSLLVFHAYQTKQKKYLFVSMGIHAFVNFGSVLLSSQSVIMSELFLLCIVGTVIVFVKKTIRMGE